METGVTPCLCQRSDFSWVASKRPKLYGLACKRHCNSDGCAEGSSLRKRSDAWTAVFFCFKNAQMQAVMEYRGVSPHELTANAVFARNVRGNNLTVQPEFVLFCRSSCAPISFISSSLTTLQVSSFFLFLCQTWRCFRDSIEVPCSWLSLPGVTDSADHQTGKHTRELKMCWLIPCSYPSYFACCACFVPVFTCCIGLP